MISGVVTRFEGATATVQVVTQEAILGVRDGLVRDANNYEQQEQASQQILSS